MPKQRTMTQGEWERIVGDAVSRAESNYKPGVTVLPTGPAEWRVASSKEDGTFYTVRRVGSGSPRKGNVKVPKWGWIFGMQCDCPSEASGFMVCWHKAAVHVYGRLIWEQRNALRTDQPMTPRVPEEPVDAAPRPVASDQVPLPDLPF